jgi:pimeloyl-ACP methyl ester carboxylesterase
MTARPATLAVAPVLPDRRSQHFSRDPSPESPRSLTPFALGNPGTRAPTASVASSAVALRQWPADGPARGRVLLIHGLSSLADSWWRIGPALAARGWDVAAVDQAGHGGRPVRGEVTPGGLADAIREVHPDGPDVLIGHSLGTVAAFGLLERDPGWAGTVILEEPASTLAPEVCLAAAEAVVADVAAVRADRQLVCERLRRDCPLWAEEDVHWAVEGIAQMDPAPFARRFTALAHDRDLQQQRTPDRIVSAAPSAYVLAGDPERPLHEGGSALGRADREELRRRLPPGHMVEIDGGHCLHRDAPDAWLAAVESACACS